MAKKLGEILLEREWLAPEQLSAALKHQKMFGGRLGTCLLELNLLSEERLTKALSEQLSVPAANLEALRQVDEGVLGLVPAKMACRARVVPIEKYSTEASVVMLDPRDLITQDELAFVTSRRLKVLVAPEVRILEALERHYSCDVETRFSRIWDRLNRARFLWQEETKAQPAPTTPAPARTAGPAPEPAQAPRAAAQHPYPEYPPERKAPPAPTDATVRRPTPLSRPQQPSAAPIESIPFEPPAPAAPPSAVEAPPQPPSAAAVLPEAGLTSREATRPLRLPRTAVDLPDLQALLEEIEERDEIAHAVLLYLRKRFQRVLLFMVRGGEVAGWVGAGAGVDGDALESFAVDFGRPSLFLNLREGSPFYRGPLPRMDSHQALAKLWGGRFPKECLLLPVRLRDRLVAVIYLDQTSAGLGGLDLDAMQQVARATGHAFEVFLMRKKQRA